MILTDYFALEPDSWLYFTIVLFLCLGLYWINSVWVLRNTTEMPTGKHFLLVTAHPDDECMFFSPTICGLVDAGNTVTVLCLSTGDAEGLGQVRQKELSKSCQILAAGSICVDSTLKDGMDIKWSSDVIAKELRQVGRNREIDIILTFDEYGVSGHPNHTAILPGIRQYKKINKLNIDVFKLTTTSLPRKYLGIGDALMTLLVMTFHVAMSPGKRKHKKKNIMCFMSSPLQAMRGQRAMLSGHASQMRWFRWFWIVIGRYMYINDLAKDNVVL